MLSSSEAQTGPRNSSTTCPWPNWGITFSPRPSWGTMPGVASELHTDQSSFSYFTPKILQDSWINAIAPSKLLLFALSVCWTAFSTATSVSDMFTGKPHPAEEWVLPPWSHHSMLHEGCRGVCDGFTSAVHSLHSLITALPFRASGRCLMRFERVSFDSFC